MAQARQKRAPQGAGAEVLEHGNIYFFYRPKVEKQAANSIDDVQRLYVVLHPRRKRKYRLLIIGEKRLPSVDREGDRRSWGFVEKVVGRTQEVEDELDPETYRTKTRGERVWPAARPAGEGVYPIVRHAAAWRGDRVHLRAGGTRMQVLMVITGADRLKLRDGTVKRTGYWAEEVAVPHELFRNAGLAVAIATPGGRPAPVDEGSLAPERNGGRPEVVAHYRQYLDSVEGLKHPLVLEELTGERVDAYDALFLPGGHGPLADLVCSGVLGDLVRRMQVGGKLVVAVCHGPAGLLPAVREDGGWAFAGYRLTAFTNQEEREAGLADKVPFLLENRLRELGARFEFGPAWTPHVVVDRNLITGQNPASSAGVAQEALAWLGAAVTH